MIATLKNVIEKRIDHLTSWLKIHGENCIVEQLHLNKNSKERIYWKYGYLMALLDIKKIIEALIGKFGE